MLTDTKIRQMKPAAKPVYASDGGGLRLQVMPAGGRWWRLKYRFAGKEKLLSLGTYPEVSLAEARARRDAARKQLAAGQDPGVQRKDEKREIAAKRDNSFAALAEAWYAKKAGTWAVSSATKVRFYLDSDLLPALGSRPIAEIRRADLIEVLGKIENRDAFNVAKKCRAWLHGIFRHALVAGVIEANPATDLDEVAKPGPKRKAFPHLSVSELPDFLRALDGYQGVETAHAIRLLLLTAVRPGELRAAFWDEFDLDAAVWSIPADRMKMRRPHVVPLPVQAVTSLRALHAMGRGRGYVFASSSDPKVYMSENTVNNAISRMGYKGRQVGHGFRHLVSTALNERGYNRDWIERQLAHGDTNEIRAVYNQADYLDRRREMMQAWADELDRLRDGRNVVSGIFGKAA